jgi:hypothetical protein
MTGTLHETQYTIIIIYLSIILSMRNVCDKSFREIRSTLFMFNDVFRTSCHLRDNVETKCVPGLVTDDNMAHEHCILGT